MIKYSRVCSTMGKNGLSFQTGICISREQRIDQDGVSYECMTIEPLNSRGEITNAWMQIPIENVDEFIKAVTELRDDYNNSAAKV